MAGQLWSPAIPRPYRLVLIGKADDKFWFIEVIVETRRSGSTNLGCPACVHNVAGVHLARLPLCVPNPQPISTLTPRPALAPRSHPVRRRTCGIVGRSLFEVFRQLIGRRWPVAIPAPPAEPSVPARPAPAAATSRRRRSVHGLRISTPRFNGPASCTGSPGFLNMNASGGRDRP